ncbi:MAG: protein-glutamate O-methyltransferase CheR [Methylococcales bacterium]|nr:protein-glutamate O-methyltransferase CheR [Methylococcales bacterium]
MLSEKRGAGGKGVQNKEMEANEYKMIQSFLSQSCGIVLGDSKQYLVKNRLAGLLQTFDLASFAELAVALQAKSAAYTKIKNAVVDAMTTNETFWFRDDMQFSELKDRVFPEIFEKKLGTIKVWSAACSSGQEPYTISMCAEDANKKMGQTRNVQIIGTDISETILLEAKDAVYTEMALARGLDSETKKRFFQKTHGGYKLNNEITRKVRFQQFNLLKPFSVLGRFDIIFCRNVLIYFSDEVKRDILSRMESSLEPGGYIFLSSTESMPVSVKGLEAVRGRRVHYFKKRLCHR